MELAWSMTWCLKHNPIPRTHVLPTHQTLNCPAQLTHLSSAPCPAVYPNLSCRTLEVPVSLVNTNLGLQLTALQIAGLLRRMQVRAYQGLQTGM